jgi:hypothetical protein
LKCNIDDSIKKVVREDIKHIILVRERGRGVNGENVPESEGEKVGVSIK